MLESPKIFISYAWESHPLRDWVRDFATDLRNNGIDAKIDRWEVSPGDNMPHFMERAIRENDVILIICTPIYKAKSDGREGGVGYESNIITGEMMMGNAQKQVIPILHHQDSALSKPSWLFGKLHIDFSNPENYGEAFEELLATIFNKREKAPELGKVPIRFQATDGSQGSDEHIIVKPISERKNIVNNKNPFLEVDLIWHHGGRTPRGYSDKNPTEVDSDGNLITIIGGGVSPIIYWDLYWYFNLSIHNNSGDVAINASIESIGDVHFSTIENVKEINNIKPYENVKLTAEYKQRLEGKYNEADQLLSYKIPQNLEGLILEINYFDEDRIQHTTLFKIENNRAINLKLK